MGSLSTCLKKRVQYKGTFLLNITFSKKSYHARSVPEGIASVGKVSRGKRGPVTTRLFHAVIHLHSILEACFLSLTVLKENSSSAKNCKFHHLLNVISF